MAPVPAGASGLRVRAAATGTWLLALSLVSVGVLPGMWPIERATMFAFAGPVVEQAYLVGYDAAGAAVPMPAHDIGVTPTELGVQLGRAMGPRIGPEDSAVLAAIGAWWNAAHPGRPVAVVHLRVRVVDLESGGFAEHHETLLGART